MLINPPQVHISLEELFKAGIPPIKTVGLPGAQGATVSGTQGMGVNTPKAAIVAAITTGLVGEEHIPKVAKFSRGLLSIILAAGAPAITLDNGNTVRGQGATPKIHWHKDPFVTKIPIL